MQLIRIAYLLLSVILVYPIKITPAKAEIITLSTVAYAANVLTVLASLLDSGAGPTETIIFQNRELLLTLHENLDRHEVNLIEINKKLNSMPREIRAEVEAAFVDTKIENVRTLIKLILQDLIILKELRSIGNATPLADAALRLHDLQVAIGNLMHNTDDLVILELIPAIYIEWALIMVQPLPQIVKEIERRARQIAYVERFKQVITSSGKSSIKSRFQTADSTADQLYWYQKNKLETIKYYKSKTDKDMCYDFVSFRVNPELIIFTDKLVDHHLGITQDWMRMIFRYVYELANYEYFILSGTHHQLKLPTLYVYNLHENMHDMILQKVEDIFKNIPGSYDVPTNECYYH